MRFLIRTGIFALQLAVFFLLLALLSLASTYFTAERYSPGNTPSTLFPVVALQPDAAAAAASKYELLRWQHLTRKDPPPLQRELRLPDAQGTFAVPVSGGFEPFVRFSAADTADGRQRVEVKVTEDDYVLYAAYVTDGKTLQAEFFRIWGPSSALIALFPAFVLTVVASRLVRRWRKNKQAGASD